MWFFNVRRSTPLYLLCLLVSALLPGTARAEGAGGEAEGMLLGTVTDAVTGAPVTGAQIRVQSIGRGELSHGDGTFHLALPPGEYVVTARRIGYAPAEKSVRVTDGDTTRVAFALQPSALDIAGVVVTGVGRERSANEVYQPTTILDGSELRRQLGSSVAATLADEPGIAQRYNGPAAAQPVIRGLSGDRVLVLEDGKRSGDIASSGSDHAVTIEPLTAERIEVVRGPAGVLYGSNALGGVINVIREEVPRTLPDHIGGSFSAQGETVNQGATAGGTLLGALGQVALRAEWSGRTASDTETPQGPLPGTDLDAYNAGAGASWIGEGFFAGAAVRDYGTRYGVPGTFGGDTIPGAHAGGVQIDLRRTATRVEAGLPAGIGPFSSVEADGNFVRYHQREIEPDGHVGTEFGQLLGTVNLIARHAHQGAELQEEGAVGAWLLWKDFAAAGSHTGSRPARQLSLAGYAFEELGRGPLRLQFGARYDWTRVVPRDTHDSAVLEDVRTRHFGAFSGSASALWLPVEGWTAGVSVSRSFRTPTVEELFSDGPHLASYSYEIGNPDLDSEFGLGTDVFIRFTLPRLHGEVTLFRNRLSDFIYYAPTGEMDPRQGIYPIYRAAQDDATLQGAEAKAQWELLPSLVLTGNASYVRGTRDTDDEPLPSIPPLHAGVALRYERVAYFLGAGVDVAGEQDRVSEFEQPTEGYALLRLTSGYRWNLWGRLHSLTLNVENATDAVWRDHLSRIRAVAPQPGRNVQLLYRVSF